MQTNVFVWISIICASQIIPFLLILKNSITTFANEFIYFILFLKVFVGKEQRRKTVIGIVIGNMLNYLSSLPGLLYLILQLNIS